MNKTELLQKGLELKNKSEKYCANFKGDTNTDIIYIMSTIILNIFKGHLDSPYKTDEQKCEKAIEIYNSISPIAI